jgi:hypothetical protein
MADLRAVLLSVPRLEFSSKVYRIVPSRYRGDMASMRGSLLHGARYNIRSYFGALYTSFSIETARREVGRYFTRPPLGGFAVATIELRLNRVLDLRSPGLPGIRIFCANCAFRSQPGGGKPCGFSRQSNAELAGGACRCRRFDGLTAGHFPVASAHKP